MTTASPGTDLKAVFADWLTERVVADARGSELKRLPGKASDRFWLGRLASDAVEANGPGGARGERLEPTALGFRFRPLEWTWTLRLRFVAWIRNEADPTPDDARWLKTPLVEVEVTIDGAAARASGGATLRESLSEALAAAGVGDRKVRIEIEIEPSAGPPEVVLTVVNETPRHQRFDEHLYELECALEVGAVEPFVLDSLPDSFRYDREVAAYGISCGVQHEGRWLRTVDAVVVDRHRPTYWDEKVSEEPDLRFATLAADPLTALRMLVDGLEAWGRVHWSDAVLDARANAGDWSPEMRAEAKTQAAAFHSEVARCRAGIGVLADDEVLSAFRFMNEAFIHVAHGGRYDSWRPFQVGFLLAILPGLVDPDHDDRKVVDTIWFATGGGKTETYLGAVVLTCLLDRIRGKRSGISVWSRFPLRMLSLQQTQRFADALAGAELVRRREGLAGDPFALGFFVGSANTPNKVREEGGKEGFDADSEDPEMPAKYQVLMRCPFCRSKAVSTRFDRRYWRLVHECSDDGCTWKEGPLPFFVVDEEIYRLLPSVVVGTLDKAATIAFQAAMRGFVGSPLKRCSKEGHGFTYAPRAKGTGCLVPGCKAPLAALDQDRRLFAPGLRVQDELHLLRDSLGAVDSHYETLLDHLQRAVHSSPPAKVICSSATLVGHDEQVQTLYCRKGRVFPLPGPAEGLSPWTRSSAALARRFVGLAPRGQTLEFANDRVTESLQRAIREFLASPTVFEGSAGLPKDAIDELVSIYGTDVAYGIRVRDVSAAAMSARAQEGLGRINVEELTGGTPLGEVRDVLERLEVPEDDFDERIHVLAASSMMSHGVDIDRLNLMCVLGMPLATAEFIQATARIGRREPGVVFVLHRMGIERDASVYRAFDQYVRQGERFVEPIPITRRSRNVLERTFPGVLAARILAVHEPREVLAGRKALSWVPPIREYAQRSDTSLNLEYELPQVLKALRIDDEDARVADVKRMMEAFLENLLDPDTDGNFVGDMTERTIMRSLREVEQAIQVRSEEGR